MKKLLSIILVITLALTFVGCGKSDTLVVGMLTQANITAKDYEKKALKGYRQLGGKVEYKFYDDQKSMISALNAKKINLVSINEKAAEYVISQNEELDYLMYNGMPNVEYGLCFDEENIEVLNMINDAIRSMKKDGTMEKLIKSYILDAINGMPLDPVSLPTLNTDLHMTIAITGDLAPYDMVDENNDAVGFNIALLSEISKRIDVNIDIIKISYKDRFKALKEDKCDGVFIAGTEKTSDAILKYKDIPELALCSEPYLSGNEVLLYSLDNENTINLLYEHMGSDAE